MCLSVAIRTIVFADSAASYGVGGGIVYDSVPEAEWQEALLKGQALAAALQPSDASDDDALVRAGAGPAQARP